MLKSLLHGLSRSRSGTIAPVLPKTVDEIGDYRERFEQAALFTRQCGYDVPKIAWLDRDVLTEDKGVRTAMAAAGVDDLSPSAGQCLKWCHYLQPFLERALEVPVVLTIGQLWKSGKPVYSPSWDDLKHWSKSGVQPSDFVAEGRSGVNLHAWLTVATGEIIEPTLMSTIALVRPDVAEHFRGAMTWGREPGFIGEHRYFPMGVGNSIAEAIGGNPHFRLLARSKEELATVAMAAVFYPLD